MPGTESGRAKAPHTEQVVSDGMLILASASPQRRMLLEELGVPFEVRPSDLPEPTHRAAHVPPVNWAEALAYFKARAGAMRQPGSWVLGADTVVACAGELLGKPVDEADARRMLLAQAGHRCDVITGLALVRYDGEVIRHIRHAITRVWLRDDTDAIDDYLAGGEWRGKAGAYGIQDIHDRLIERIDGSFSNVVGLPVGLTRELLIMAGFRPLFPGRPTKPVPAA